MQNKTRTCICPSVSYPSQMQIQCSLEVVNIPYWSIYQCLIPLCRHLGNIRYWSLPEFQSWTWTSWYFPHPLVNFHKIQNPNNYCSPLVSIKLGNQAWYTIKTHWFSLGLSSLLPVRLWHEIIFPGKRFCNNYQQRQGGIVLCGTLCISNYTLWNFITHLNSLCVNMISKCWLLRNWL